MKHAQQEDVVTATNAIDDAGKNRVLSLGGNRFRPDDVVWNWVMVVGYDGKRVVC